MAQIVASLVSVKELRTVPLEIEEIVYMIASPKTTLPDI
jgi:hypothetical protein